MHVVVLHRKMEQPKPSWVAARRAQQREANRREKMLTAQRSEARAQCDVHGLTRAVARASPMWRRRAGGRLAASALPRTTPVWREGERKLVPTALLR
jgi:hypothetical protein